MHVLAKFRKENELTQRELAKIIGFKNGQSICDIERGRIDVRAKAIKLISLRLGHNFARKLVRYQTKKYKERLEALI